MFAIFKLTFVRNVKGSRQLQKVTEKLNILEPRGYLLTNLKHIRRRVETNLNIRNAFEPSDLNMAIAMALTATQMRSGKLARSIDTMASGFRAKSDFINRGCICLQLHG